MSAASTPVPSARRGVELIWVNASEEDGPTARDNRDARNHQIYRINFGQVRVISRSSSAETASLVNDLSREIYFSHAKVVSREHAMIEWLDGKPIIKDLGSTHGTFVSHVQATVLASGVEAKNPFASLQPVTGAMAIQDGDLIEFGKVCARSGLHYNPVRCYVRFIRDASSSSALLQSAGSSKSVSGKPSSSYGLSDDLMDSESDIMSIDADTFHASSQRHLSNLSTSTQVTVVDLSGDDSDEEDDEEAAAFSKPFIASASTSPVPQSASPAPQTIRMKSSRSPQPKLCTLDDSEAERESYSDESSVGSPLSSESDFDSDDNPNVLDYVTWRNEIDEAASENAELAQENLEARLLGDSYMKEYKDRFAHGEDCILLAATSAQKVGLGGLPARKQADSMPSATQGAKGAVDSARSISEAPPASTSSLKASQNSPETGKEVEKAPVSKAPAAVASTSVTPMAPASKDATSQADAAIVKTIQATTVSSALAATKVEKLASYFSRKRYLEQTLDETPITTSDTDMTSATESPGGSDSSFSASDASTSCTSVTSTPSPAKKQRITYILQDESPRQRQAPSRSKVILDMVGKAMTTTSLLSVGFVSGSLFTFRSMMNAAAAANASGSGPQ